MTDHTKRQEYLDESNLGGMSNKRAVTLMMLALFVSPVLVAIVKVI